MYRATDEGIIVELKVVPNSSKNGFVLPDSPEQPVKLKVTAQPIENKANKAVIEYLSKYFKVPKTSIVVLRGETSKEKTILLKTADEAKLEIIKQTFQTN